MHIDILFFLGLGLGLKRLTVFPENTGQVLNQLVIYVSFPALVLLKIPQLKIDTHVLIPLVLPWVMGGVAVGLVFLFSRFRNWSKATLGCLLLMIPLGNTSFFGFPMVEAFMGKQALPYAIVYDQTGSFLALVTYGTLILAIFGAGQTVLKWNVVLKKIFLFPPFLAGFLAFCFRSVDYSTHLETLLNPLASTLVPLVMIAIGFQIQFRLQRDKLMPLLDGLLLKLILIPLLLCLVFHWMGIQGEALKVSLFEAGMPPMVTAGILACQEDLEPTLATALVGFGLLISFLTLPMLNFFLGLLF